MNIRDKMVGETSELPDGPDSQDNAPVLEALQTYLRASPISFEMPGHHAGRGAPHAITRLIGSKAFKADCTPLKGLDDRGERKRISHRAERLAAELWGADSCFFSTSGSTLSNQVAVRAAANPGDTVLVSRNSHKSLIGSLILAGVKPVFLDPRYDDRWDIDHGQSRAEVAAKLEAHPETKAVFIVSPTYCGVTPDIEGIATLSRPRYPAGGGRSVGSAFCVSPGHADAIDPPRRGYVGHEHPQDDGRAGAGVSHAPQKRSHPGGPLQPRV
jgi:arginine/lysine/ornithine decarboxylase